MKPNIESILTCCVFLFLSISIHSQNLSGKVVDTANNPIPYSNVIALENDSIFAGGAVTNEEGFFTLPFNANLSGLRISCIGYKSKNVSLANELTEPIVLDSETQLLNDVVVTAKIPTYRLKPDGLETIVQNSVLSHLGTAKDVLSQLPFVSEDDGTISVIGRGEPLIYINNRLIRDKSELRQIKSEDIKSIKTILNPGSEYDASVKSVILITTKSMIAKGFSLWAMSELYQSRKFSHDESVKLSYSTEKVDIFTLFSFAESKGKQTQNTQLVIPNENNVFSVFNDGTTIYKGRNYQIQTDLNYTINQKNKAGFRYAFTKTPFSDSDFDYNIFTDENFTPGFEGKTKDIRSSEGYRHYINTYYNFMVSDNFNLHFDGDFVYGKNTEDQNANSYNTIDQNIIYSNSSFRHNYKLFAGKLSFDWKIKSGNLKFGADVSYTDNKQNYQTDVDTEMNIGSSKNTSNQTNLAGFLSYNVQLENFNFNVGSRYESSNFNYWLNDEKLAEQSKRYKGLYPTATISYRISDVAMSINYRSSVSRPTYYQLRSNISYNDPFTYEGGNPTLKPTKMNNINYTFSWNDLQFTFDYVDIKNGVLFYADKMDGVPAVLFSTTNKNLNLMATTLSYNMNIGKWKSSYMVNYYQQKLKHNGLNYNEPLFSFAWNNLIELPFQFIITVNTKGNLKGVQQFQTLHSNVKSDISIIKTFKNSGWKITLGAKDILNTNRMYWNMDINNILVEKKADNDIRGVFLNISYNINNIKRNYKGSSAAKNEINRL